MKEEQKYSWFNPDQRGKPKCLVIREQKLTLEAPDIDYFEIVKERVLKHSTAIWSYLRLVRVVLDVFLTHATVCCYGYDYESKQNSSNNVESKKKDIRITKGNASFVFSQRKDWKVLRFTNQAIGWDLVSLKPSFAPMGPIPEDTTQGGRRLLPKEFENNVNGCRGVFNGREHKTGVKCQI